METTKSAKGFVTCRIEWISGNLEGIVMVHDIVRELAKVGKVVSPVMVSGKYRVVEVIG